MYGNGQWNRILIHNDFVEEDGHNDTGSNCPVSFRSFDFPSSSFDSFGFRIALYLQQYQLQH